MAANSEFAQQPPEFFPEMVFDGSPELPLQVGVVFEHLFDGQREKRRLGTRGRSHPLMGLFHYVLPQRGGARGTPACQQALPGRPGHPATQLG